MAQWLETMPARSRVLLGIGIVVILILVVIVLALIALHFLPGIIASRRHHPIALAIWLVNIFFGWTGIGWLITLIWALN